MILETDTTESSHSALDSHLASSVPISPPSPQAKFFYEACNEYSVKMGDSALVQYLAILKGTFEGTYLPPTEELERLNSTNEKEDDELWRIGQVDKADWLILKGLNLGTAEIMLLLLALQGPACTIKKLDLSSNQMMARHVKLLFPLKNKITHLDLSDNPLGEEGIQEFQSVFGREENSSLIYLSLKNTQLRDVGAIYAAEILSNYSALTHLNLAGNTIADNGGAAIAASLKDSHSIQTLVLDDNLLGDKTAIAFAASIFQIIRLQKKIL